MNDQRVKKKKRLAKGMVFTAILISLVLFLFTHWDKKKIPQKKQIILISIDTLRGDHLSSYGYFRDTSPHLSRLVKDSAYYINAYANGCWTIPSHMSLLTGTLPSRHGINNYWGSPPEGKYPKLNDKIKTIAQILKTRHIDTIKFVLLPDELGFAKGFDKDNRYDPFFTDNTFKNVLKEIENHKEKNFFLFIHTWMVHAPYSNCNFLEEKRVTLENWNYINNFRRLSPAKDRLTDDFQEFLQKNQLFNRDDCVTLYDSGIHYVDRCVGKIIEKTKQLGIYKELMFIVVSDHGEHFDEHYPNNFYSYHGKDFFEEFIKVPIIIKYPFKYKHGTFQHPVSLVDIFPTIMDFYEFEIPDFVQGGSLLKPVTERNRKYIISEAISEGGFEKKMIRLGDLKFIVTMTTEESFNRERTNWKAVTQRRLFDLKNDPLEQKDLYPDLKFRRICMDLEKKLVQIIKNSAQSNFQVRETAISKETLKQLKTLGYL
ncbi:MAG: sulfatase-like hydrolase/transferase [Candidatus Aminicenantes bacterium]|nr:sulfatase-like hydrolase/transferase [Candidatus Aminicenantes bacterium]NIO87226.1 sulfatase-like hydrolase/transferase [Candidatus Aminicenantes bacterium]NIQ73060.1 sulfatase-like hydrolase/transferase [Candidatus Aminicenantes bacterium]